MIDKETFVKVMSYADGVDEPVPQPDTEGGAPPSADAGADGPQEQAEAKPGPAQPGVESVLSEYGYSKPGGPLAQTEDAEALRGLLAEMEAKLESATRKVGKKVYSMDESEVNERVSELRESGKHTEAEALLTDWKSRVGDEPEAITKAKLAAAQRNIAAYSQRSPQFKATIDRPDVQEMLSKLPSSALNLHDPAGVAWLHLGIQGMLMDEITKKAYEMGRNSVQVQSPKKASSSAVAAETSRQAQSTPRKKLSELL